MLDNSYQFWSTYGIGQSHVDASDPNALIFNRFNCFWKANLDTWREALSAYNGGREYLEDALKQHPSEMDEEFQNRLDASYNLNLIKYAVRNFGDYIFNTEPRREFDKKSKALCETVERDFDRQRQHANIVMRKAFDFKNLCGLVWLFVDAPAVDGNVITERTRNELGFRPWCSVLSPFMVPDWCFGESGELEWAIIEEYITKKSDPTKLPKLVKRRTLYTREYYQRFELELVTFESKDVNTTLQVFAPVSHNLGVVPLIPFSDILFDPNFFKPEIADILTISKAVQQGESELLTNILKQTYGQLVLPCSSQNLVSRIKSRLAESIGTSFDPTDPSIAKVIEREFNLILSRTKAIFEDGEEDKGISRYIQPSGANIASIMEHDDRLISLVNKLMGLVVGVSTTQRASAESKAADYVGLAAQLRNISSKLQELEGRVWDLFRRYDGAIAPPILTYNKDYDLHDFKSIMTGIVELSNINGGSEYNRQLKRTATKAMNSIHAIDDKTYRTILEEIRADSEADKPITYQDQPEHLTEASGSRPDGIVGTSNYVKSNASASKTTVIS